MNRLLLALFALLAGLAGPQTVSARVAEAPEQVGMAALPVAGRLTEARAAELPSRAAAAPSAVSNEAPGEYPAPRLRTVLIGSDRARE